MRFPVVLLLLLLSIARAAERPNILFIKTDDHAAHAMSCYGSKVNETPVFNRFDGSHQDRGEAVAGGGVSHGDDREMASRE